jgi:pilus assembly protein CpaB
MIFVVGLALAGGAAYYVFAEVKAAKARLQPVKPLPTVDVAVAKAPLKFGMELTRKHVRMVRWPADAAPENGFTDIKELFADDGAVRTALRRMEPNEPILKSKVTGFGEKVTVAALIEDGMRAFTLPVNAANSVGGFITPGARIDLFLTIPDRRKGPTTRLLMQNIEVVAVDQNADPDRTEARVARTVTVQGTPEQVRELMLGTSLGAISIALRGFGSDKVADLGPLDRNMLLGIEAPEPEAAPEPEPEPEPAPQVVVRRGNAVEVTTLD